MSARAALFHGPGRGFTLERFPRPMLAAGEALVRVEATTLCGSDLRSVAGRRTVPIPSILGHEIVGRIEALQGEVSAVDGHRLRLGERVVWSVIVACGACDRCKRGLTQKCRSLFKFGHSAQPAVGARFDGGLAELVHIPRGAAIVRVNESVPPAIAALSTCAGATAAAVARVATRDRGYEGARVLIHGAGALGLFGALFARQQGAVEIHVVDVDRERLALAQRLGATASHLLPRLPEAVRDAAQEPEALRAELARGFDVSLELSGEATACERAVRAANVGGAVVLAGAVSPVAAARFDPELIVRRMVRIEGVHNYRTEDLEAAVALVGARQGAWPAELAAPPATTLADLDRAFEVAVRERPMRVMVTA